MMVRFIAITLSCISLFSTAADYNNTKMSIDAQRERIKMDVHKGLKDAFVQVFVKDDPMTTDSVYELLSANMPQHARTVGENLAEVCASFAGLVYAHELRTDAFFHVYKDGRAKTTDDLDRKKSRKQIESWRLTQHIPPSLWQRLVSDDTLQETRKACQKVADAMQGYNALQKPTELAQAHMSYARGIGQACGALFLTDPLLQEESILNEQGRLNHSTKRRKDYLKDVRDVHLPTLLRAQKQQRTRDDKKA